MVDHTRRGLLRTLFTGLLVCYDELRGKDNIPFSLVERLDDAEFGEVRMLGYKGSKQKLCQERLYQQSAGESAWRLVLELDRAEAAMVAGFIRGACVADVVSECQSANPEQVSEMMGICRKLVGTLMEKGVFYPDSPCIAGEFRLPRG